MEEKEPWHCLFSPILSLSFLFIFSLFFLLLPTHSFFSPSFYLLFFSLFLTFSHPLLFFLLSFFFLISVPSSSFPINQKTNIPVLYTITEQDISQGKLVSLETSWRLWLTGNCNRKGWAEIHFKYLLIYSLFQVFLLLSQCHCLCRMFLLYYLFIFFVCLFCF